MMDYQYSRCVNKNTTHSLITCPFFVWDERLAIHGECGRPKFPDTQSIEDYTRQYCSGNWKACSLAQNLVKYYESERSNYDRQIL